MTATLDPVAPAGSSLPRAGTASRPEPGGISLLSGRLKALSDPTRLRILRRLLKAEGAVCVCEIAEGFRLGQPTISHHLKTLRRAGLVRAHRRGTWVYYEPDREALAAVRTALGHL